MSTSSLQQYRSYNQKPSVGHGSRKQLHPQHIIRPVPATTVIHQMIQDQKNQIPVILPTSVVTFYLLLTKFLIEFSTFFCHSQSDHVIMSNNLSPVSNQIPATQSTVVAISSQQGLQGINNIYVRPINRTQQIFQTSHQHLNTIITNNNMSSLNIQPQQQQQQQLQQQQQQQQPIIPPKMRNQPNNQKPPPGSVNLERSYQICQAVIQNSTNRLQLGTNRPHPPLNCQKKF